jgi:hypothetical protein
MDLSAGFIAAAAGAVLSLVLNYVPGLNAKFAVLSSEAKSGIVALSLVLIAGLVAASSCLNLWVWLPCTQGGLMQLGECLLFALIANQSVYKLSPQTELVRQVKATR